jgi:hypothetical protein
VDKDGAGRRPTVAVMVFIMNEDAHRGGSEKRLAARGIMGR